MKRPSDDEIEMAIAWLECNEGFGGESESCVRVADWLGQQLADRQIRDAARKAGVPVKTLREKLRSSTT